MKSTRLKALVAGAGAAGIKASLDLADAGLEVEVFERLPTFGGRARSLVDPITKRLVDNCQHIVMGCTKEIVSLWERLGTGNEISWYSSYRFLGLDGEVQTLGRSFIPGRLGLVQSFLSFSLLSIPDRLRVGLLLAEVARGGAAPARLRNISTARFLAEKRQSRHSIKVFWEPLLVSALNDSLGRVAASEAWFTLKNALLGGPGSADMGIPDLPLSQMFGNFPVVLNSLGGYVHLNRMVRSVVVEDGRAVGLDVEVGDGRTERHKGDIVVLALPAGRLARLLPPPFAEDDFFRRLYSLRTSPIVAVHLFYDTNPMDIPHTALLGRPFHFLFSRPGGHVTAVVSAAERALRLPREALIEEAAADVSHAFPSRARLGGAVVVKEPEATFTRIPGEGPRSGPRTPIGRLFIAGDWTDTGWPSTMESAVISGAAAAAAALEENRSG